MGNGRTELDAVGCEFGRMLAKDVGYMKQDLGEIKQELKGVASKDDVKELKCQVETLTQAVNDLARKQESRNWLDKAAEVLLASGIGTAIGFVFGKRG